MKAKNKVERKRVQKRVSFAALIELMRPLNCVIAAVAILIGFFIAGGSNYWAGAIAALSGFFVCAGGQAINDYFDRKIDAITSKNRPIPSGRISARKALWFSLILFILGIGFASEVNIAAQFIAVIMTILLVAYPLFMNKFKYFGNAVVSAGTAITFVFGAASAGNILPLVVVLSIAAFFSNMGREVTKDIEDVRKDAGAKKTIPIMIGFKRAKTFPILFYALAVIVAVMVFFTYNLKPAYLFVTLIAGVMFVYASEMLLEYKPKKSQRFSKIGMIISLVAFIMAGL